MENTILNEAISYLTEEDEEVVKLRKLEKIEGIENILAGQKLAVIFRAKNEKFIFDFNDTNVRKYYPWIYLENRFRWDNDYSMTTDGASVSRRLCLKSKEILAELMSKKEILELYKIYLS